MIKCGIVLCLLFSQLSCAGKESIRLTDYEVKPINTTYPIEPSGLTSLDGQLYTVCDDANAIFRLQPDADGEWQAEVAINLDTNPLSASSFDLEGITVVEGQFFVVSEVHHKMLRVSEGHLSWVPEHNGVYQSAYKAGLFQLHNAGLEAVAYLGDQRFLLSVERQPRGVIEVTFDAQFEQIISQTNQVFNDTAHQLDSHRHPDLTGLYVYDGVIYALHRNAYVIHELIKGADGLYHEGKTWSYEHIVKDPQYAYQDMQYGHAEGLVVDADYFYLVLDNNNDPRLKNPNDRRPLLIKARRQ
ncbi:SdiA-regulated domain-containing protein [Marinicella sediminis]|uniref:SdiA-regulated domain-containing protein n=1 Tax=Marinicella sediminis TaxID=1792834 RepID=A0ABV7J673_9GAMM|nr:SdiA-regulated domain-containing protein [Marinicella sediminis]